MITELAGTNFGRITLIALFCFAPAGFASADPVTASSDPGGFVSISIPASSDFRLTVPMVQTPQFVGTVQMVSGSTLTITQVNNLPAWGTNALVYSGTGTSTYYALLASGSQEGMHSLITANTAHAVTVNLGGDSYADVAAGDQVKIVPCLTLGALLSGSSVTPSLPDGTEFFVFNGNVPGVNVSASVSYKYYLGYGWYNSGTLANDTPLMPGQAFIIRNHSTSSFSVAMTGAVPVNKHYSLVTTLSANRAQDNPIGYLSPVPATIGQVGLGFTSHDQLFVYDNTSAGFNKSASQILTYYTGYGWYDGGTLVDGTFQLQPGYGYVLRKVATSTPSTWVWQNKQAYLP